MALADVAKLSVELSLDDKLSPAVAQINRRLGAFSGAVNRNLGRAVDSAASFAARKLVGAFTGGVESLRKLEVATAQTNAVIKSTGGAAGETAASIVALSEKYESLNATIDNKVIQSGENVLLTFTNIRKDAFEPALQAALDLNQAMGGGEAGLQGTMVQLGKALNDPIKGITALQRVGVSFSADQKAQIKDLVAKNDLYGAQKIILGELTKEFGGSFAAAGNTAAGAQAKLADSVEDVEAAFAGKLLPVVTKVTDKINNYLAKPETLAFFDKLGGTIAGLFSDQNLDAAAGAIETAASAVSMAITAFNSLPPEIKALAIGAFAINKVTGGAVGGIASTLGNVLGKGLSKIFAANVTVIGANVTGAGIGGAASAAEGAIPGAVGAGALGAGAAISISALAAAGFFVALYSAMQQHPDVVNPGLTPSQGGDVFSRGHGFGRPSASAPTPYSYGDQAGALQSFRQGERDSETWAPVVSATRDLASAMRHPSWINDLRQVWQKQGEVTRAQLNLARKDIASGTNIAKAAGFLGSSVSNKGAGSGGSAFIRATIHDLQGALKKTYDPVETHAIVKAIRELRAKLPQASKNDALLHRAEKIAASTESTSRKIKELKAELRKVEAPGLRKKLEDIINKVPKETGRHVDDSGRKVGQKTDDARRGIQQRVHETTSAVQRSSSTIEGALARTAAVIVAGFAANRPVVTVTAGAVQKEGAKQGRYGPANGSAGGGHSGRTGSIPQ